MSAVINHLTINGVELRSGSARSVRSIGGVWAIVMLGRRGAAVPVDFATCLSRSERIVSKLNGLEAAGNYRYGRGRATGLPPDEWCRRMDEAMDDVNDGGDGNPAQFSNDA